MRKLLYCIPLLLCLGLMNAWSQKFDFKIRTITAGITLKTLDDTTALKSAIVFLKSVEKAFTQKGYEVQTLRIATNNLYSYLHSSSLEESIPFLQRFDEIVQRNGVILSIGQVLAENKYYDGIAGWASELVKRTNAINFSLPISSEKLGVLTNSIKASAEVITTLSREGNGEANFRFSASANCPPGIPFFPAAYHAGPNSFAIGLESAALLTKSFNENHPDSRQALKKFLEIQLMPVEKLGEQFAGKNWLYGGIDLSPAPGLHSSIGLAIETFTKQPFGNSSTLSACAMITDVLKKLDIKKCGYSGLMLPVIEDTVLAKRAIEERFSLKELLLYSSVSGTGLDVIPIPGDTPKEKIERLLLDVAALSVKYSSKPLSARLFPIPGKKAGELVDFQNPYLTKSRIMKID